MSHSKDKSLSKNQTKSNRRLYHLAVQRTARMVQDRKAQRLARRHGLEIFNVTWEDTARFKDSAVGPNISDMTIQVQYQNPETGELELSCMPVIRFPNFSDVTGDIDPDLLSVLVGNQKPAATENPTALQKITLRELLETLRKHLSDPSSWAGDRTSLLAPDRDSHVLVSAQACFLPVPPQGIAEFNPVVFNYQSRKDAPAVLAILATREGTSVTVIDNQRDRFDAGGTWGQRLFFNAAGERASLTGQRRSEFAVANAAETATDPASDIEDREGLNLVLLIQVPLKQKPWEPDSLADTDYDMFTHRICMAAPASDVEDAIIGHGEVEGPFTEIDNLEIERDDQYPIRVTVQFYKATSNGVVSPEDMEQIDAQIRRVYEETDYVGSLVVEGRTDRPTEHSGEQIEPPDWWKRFWEKHFRETGQSQAQAMAMLAKLLGPDWMTHTKAEIEKRFQQGGEESSQTP